MGLGTKESYLEIVREVHLRHTSLCAHALLLNDLAAGSFMADPV